MYFNLSIPLIKSPLPIPLLPINFWIRRGIWRRRVTVIRHSPRKRSVLTGVVNIFPTCQIKKFPYKNFPYIKEFLNCAS